MIQQPVDAARNTAVFGPLTDAVRGLIDAAIMSDVDDVTALQAHALVTSATGLLDRQRLSGQSFGVRRTTDGNPAAWGNVVVGSRNPIAPPLTIVREESGKATAEFSLGAGYEGPPGCVHGGICALILDHILGSVGHEPGLWAATGTLTLRYRRPTALGRLRAEAWAQRFEGVKMFAAGHIVDDQGVTVDAEGVFIRQPSGDKEIQ